MILYHTLSTKGKRKEVIFTAYIKKTDNPKMGRPTQNPRTVDLRVRLSEGENALLEEIMSMTEKSKTQIVVEALKHYYGILQK